MTIIQERLALAIANNACPSAVEELTEKTDEEILHILKEDFSYLSWLLEKNICTPQELFSCGLAKELKGEVEEINGGFWVCLTTATVGKVTGGLVTCRNGSTPTIGTVTYGGLVICLNSSTPTIDTVAYGGLVTCWDGSNPNIGTVTGGWVDCNPGSNPTIDTVTDGGLVTCLNGSTPTIGTVTDYVVVTCRNGSKPNIGTVTHYGVVVCRNGSNVLIHTAKPEAEIRLYDGAVVKIENDERRKSA